MKNKKTEFWICNISEMNVTLRDLAISVPAKKGINLLSKHYSFSYDQLKKSMTTGSIFIKRDKIKVSKGPPQENTPPDQTVCKYPIVMRRKIYVPEIEEVTFDEFNFSDEQFADEMSKEFDEDL